MSQNGVDIRALNQTYLVVLRDALKSNRAQACAQFGVDEKLAKRVEDMTLAEINELSKTDKVLFKTSLTSDFIDNLVKVTDLIKRAVFATLAG